MNASIRCSFRGVLLLLASTWAGCRPEDRAVALPPFDGSRAYAEVERLVEFSPRDAGTPGAKAAAEWLLGRLRSFGVEAGIDEFADATPAGRKTFRNVVGRIPGSNGRWVVLGSHFDTMPGIPDFRGANDSGSSSGILLETARMLADSARRNGGRLPGPGVLIAFFDGEEGIANYAYGDGLHGSRHFADLLRKPGEYRCELIDAVVVLDMVGDADLEFTVAHNNANRLVRLLLAVAHEQGKREIVRMDRSIDVTDDHQPFLNLGLDAIDLIDFHYGSAPGLNDYWHTSADNLDHVSVESLETTGNLLYGMLKTLLVPE